MTENSKLILVGQVAGGFGVKGEVRVTAYTAEPITLLSYGVLLRADGSPGLTLTGGRAEKSAVVGRAKEIATKEEADALRGLKLYIPRDKMPEPDEDEPALVIGELVIDPRSRAVTLAGTEVSLSRKEFDVLLVLASRVGAVVTKRELLTEVWQQPYGGADRTVDVHLSWLRRKLGETAARPRYLHSVRGVGVRLVNPGAEAP